MNLDLPPMATEPAGYLEQPQFISRRVWIAVRALYRAHGQLGRLEGDHLELLLRTRWYARCGYGSFRDFVREELHLSPRTARRRVALSRLTSESPELAAALDSGRLSPCQVLALSRLRDAPDLKSWIAMAQDCTVRDLEQLVTHYLLDLSSETDDQMPAPEPAALESEEPGRRVTFAAPLSAAVVWQHGLDMAQKVLGWDAPTYRCIEAILDENAVGMACSEANPLCGHDVASFDPAGKSFSPPGPGDDVPPIE
ncbi:MAG TPA: hypothetical protein VFP10_10735, partial [Candidatus Eisenbacteria bacterium]|nr:hypothetical protein [Candidatus Eisenbacteria bacterium]